MRLAQNTRASGATRVEYTDISESALVQTHHCGHEEHRFETPRTGFCVYCIIKFPKVAEAIPQSCRGNFPNNAAVFGASLSLLGW